MSFAIVGTIGASSGIGVSGAASTPAYGTSETRVAGNLLVCWCNGLNAGTLPGTPAGWSILSQLGTGSTSGSTVSATVFVKVATGSDAAPTIAGATNVQWQTQLAEFTGNGTIVINDQVGSATTVSTSPIVANNAAIDVAAAELFLWSYSLRNTAVAAAVTATPTTNNGTTTNSTQNNATSVANHYHNGWGVVAVNTAADQMSMAFTPTTNVNRVAMVVGSVRLLPPVTKFIEPGGDADFGVALWPTTAQTGTAPAAASDFVHGQHKRSVKYFNNGTSSVVASAVVVDVGGRASQWFYFNALPAATATIVTLTQTGGGTPTIRIRITTAGLLQVWDSAAQRGSNGTNTITTGSFFRVSWAWVITSTSVNQVRVWVNGNIDITNSNTTITTVTSADYIVGNGSGDASLDMRSSDHYVDNSTALTDPGNMWVTAKRPFANGTTTNFTTQIGAGGSGYGSGHAPQVNERALSTTNGWSMIGAGSAVTEEYTIEKSGDGDMAVGTIIDFMGWVYASSLSSETASIIVANVTSNIALTSSNTMFKQIAGSAIYPAGGTDIGIITTTAVTTVSLYEAGIVVAFIQALPVGKDITPLNTTLGALISQAVNRTGTY